MGVLKAINQIHSLVLICLFIYLFIYLFILDSHYDVELKLFYKN
jgi:uncharacterized membrane protein YesL